jgi:hypothetical protein
LLLACEEGALLCLRFFLMYVLRAIIQKLLENVIVLETEKPKQKKNECQRARSRRKSVEGVWQGSQSRLLRRTQNGFAWHGIPTAVAGSSATALPLPSIRQSLATTRKPVQQGKMSAFCQQRPAVWSYQRRHFDARFADLGAYGYELADLNTVVMGSQ